MLQLLVETPCCVTQARWSATQPYAPKHQPHVQLILSHITVNLYATSTKVCYYQGPRVLCLALKVL